MAKCKVFMPTPLNDERAVNTITYLRLNVHESFLVSMFMINQIIANHSISSSQFLLLLYKTQTSFPIYVLL